MGSTVSTQRVVTLRGELWRRHVLVRDMESTDAGYELAVSELLDLTSALVRAEAATSDEPPRRGGGARRGRVDLACVVAVLLTAAAGLAVVARLAGVGMPPGTLPALLVVSVVAVAVAVRRLAAEIGRPPGSGTTLDRG